MKLIAKNVTRECANRILDQIPYTCIYFTGGMKTTTYHYCLAPRGSVEALRITRNNDTNLYNVRIMVK